MKPRVMLCLLHVVLVDAVNFHLPPGGTEDVSQFNLRKLPPRGEIVAKLENVATIDPDAARTEEANQSTKELAQQKLAESEDQVQETLEKVKRVDLTDMVRRDMQMLRDVFMPGLEPSPKIIGVTSTIVGISMAWLLVYFLYIYRHDRCEHLDHWGVPDEGTNPTSDQPDRDKEVTWAELHKTLVCEVSTWRIRDVLGAVVRSHPNADAAEICTKQEGDVVRGHLVDGWVALAEEPGYVATRSDNIGPVLEHMHGSTSEAFGSFRSVMKAATDGEFAHSPLQHFRRARQSLGSNFTAVDELAEHQIPTTLAARTALLQDLYLELPRWGFDVTIFSSIDDDELYVCITLGNPVAVESYLLRSGVMLQIRQDVVSKLGISQPPEEVVSSPPMLRYDPRIVKNLHKAGVLERDDPRDLFKTHYGKSKEGCIVKGSDRFMMIFRQVCTHLDLDAAKSKGLLVDWYPAHSQRWLSKLSKSWGKFSLMTDLTFLQPVNLIHDYFGARVAFIFAWNGFYCKALFALSLLAIIIELAGWIARSYIDAVIVQKRVVLAFSIVTVVWARLAVNMWTREQQFFLKMWEMTEDSSHEVPRPSFQGEKQPSPADLNLMVKQYPAHSAAARRFCSTLFTLVFCCLVAACIILWFQIFQGNLDLAASVCLSVMIVFFQLVYNLLVPVLTEWENHEYQSTYYDSYVCKQFMFECVNRYSAFFFLAVKQRWTEAGCPHGGCMASLKKQLWMTLLILSASRIAQIFVASIIVRLKIMWEDYNLKKGLKQEGKETPKRSFAELQSKFAETRLQEQIDNMMQLVLALGFILLFGPVAPIIVPFCLAVFVIQLRGSAYMLVRFSKRTLPRQQFGIGIWGTIVNMLMHVSVLFSGFLIIVYGDTFAGTPLLTKMAGIIIYVLCMQVVWLLVDLAYPAQSSATKILQARRDRVRKVVLEKATDLSAKMAEVDEDEDDCSPCSAFRTDDGKFLSVNADLVEEVKQGEWDKIPHMQDAVSSRSGVNKH
mmetsp:Transcript_176811/g.567125  ORF Transcript_176811/g.567125 Transcript_176811/m.567125 type:complete len:1003 (-) Transcript_176811:133-3141(-)